MPVPLTPSSTGYVTGNAAAVTGAWYAYGDSWGTEMEMGMAGVAGEEGNCQLLGGFPTSSCSSITSPLPAFPVDAGTAAAGDAAAATDAALMVPAGYDNGFPPSATGAMCLTGNAAKVITPDGGTAPDYSDIFGIGIGLDFNNMGGVKSAYNATANKVVGVTFTLSGVSTLPSGSLRVEFPTTQTEDGGAHPTDDSYDIQPAADGSYTVLWTQFAGAPVVIPAPDANISYIPPVDGGLAAEPPFDPTQLLSIQFHVATNTMAAIPVMNLCVSNLNAIVSTSM